MRRKSKNPLLLRIVLVSILVHIIVLPILAHFGAFKKIQQQYMDTQLVTLPPLPKEPPKPEPKPPKRVERKAVATTRKPAAAAQHRGPTARQTPLNIPRVMASVGGPGGGGEGPTVDATGTGKVGEIPAGDNGPKTPPPAPPSASTPQPPSTPQPRPQPVLQPPAPPHAPVVTMASPTFSPSPTIPDSLRSEALDRTFVAEFTIGPDGTPVSIKVAHSTGMDELDRLAMEAAKQWRFSPATRDGQPIEGILRLHIEFQVT